MATVLSLRWQKATFSFDFGKTGGSFFRFFQRFCFNNHLFLSRKKRGGLFSCPEHSFLQSAPPVLLDAGKKVVFDAGASSEVHGVGANGPLVQNLRRLLAPAECFSGQAEGQTCPLACCLPHAGRWKCGQGQATRLVVACRGASGPLDGTASCWHPRRR